MNKLSIFRFRNNVARYTMLKHKRTPVNTARYVISSYFIRYRVQLNVHYFDVPFFVCCLDFLHCCNSLSVFFFKQRFEDMVTCFCYGYTKCTLKIFKNRNVRVYVSILLAGRMTNDQTLIHLPIIYGF